MQKRPMGELEAAVMDVLWDKGGWVTPGEVHENLVGERPLAYTTVMTILVRLWDKGLLERQRDGRAYAYHPLKSREDYVAARMGQLLASAGDRSVILTRFLDTIDPADRTQLRRMLLKGRRDE